MCTCLRACVRVRACPCVMSCHVARTSAVKLRRYDDTPQTITIDDSIEILLLCAAHETVKFSFFMS